MMIGYRYMLKEVATTLSQDNITFGELSRRLNLGPKELKELLETMEREGDMEISCMSPPPDTTSCAGCGMGHACPGTNLGIGRTYRLTEKGRKLCCE
ncbi:FeoC-like transcriptional regulator [Methanococcoides seepicolus]|jgi:FeoC-like transcriptional regulator|uniref:Transcriptional regulator HTH-type FeoC domain-containing protein n=1 Tax=Methanococcoides seepicolus TaxID=2828780 RepID=A0A9E4ZFT6_9EURY|nr:FeoC-like transcriptional regulator [Methanococcoides seepicolus]MCM1986927.1 hypothetical protein [Methanococcoides seepicolus]